MKNKIKLQSLNMSRRWLRCTASLKYNKDFIANINTLKRNLIHIVSALKLREIFLNENHSKEIERLKTSDYFNKNNVKLKTKWDYSCDKAKQNYIEYAIRLKQQFNPHTIEVKKRVDLDFYGYHKHGFIDLYMESEDYVIIVDLKTSRSRDDAEDNSYMMMFGIGIVQEHRRKKIGLLAVIFYLYINL